MKGPLRERLVEQASAAAYSEINALEKELATDEETDRIVALRERLEALVSGVVGTADGLLDAEAPEDAELLLTPVLRRVEGELERERLEAVLARFKRARAPAFNLALARWLSHRPTPVFLQLAPELDAKSLGEGAAAELGEVLARLWLESTEEDRDEAEEGLVLIGKLQREGASVQQKRLGEGIAESFAGGIPDQPQLERHRELLRVLEEVVSLGLHPGQSAADVVLELATRTLAGEAAEGVEEGVAEFLQRCFAFAADQASPSKLVASREALAASPWIAAQSPQAETIRLWIEAGLEREKDSPESPFSPAKIRELARAHGSKFVPGAILWLRRFDPSVAQVNKGLGPMLRGNLHPRLAKAVSEYAKGLTPLGRYRLVRPVIEWPSLRNPPRSLLRTLGIREADPAKVTEAIIGRFKNAGNNSQRQAALDIWRAFEPTDDPSRRILIKEVFIPLLRQGVGGYRIARKYLELCENPPRGTKGKLIDALEDAPRRKERRSMQRRMEQVGLKARGKK